MLQALIAYAERESLGDADFEAVGVRWLIPIDNEGGLAGDPIPLAANSAEKKARPRPMSRPFTSANDLNQGTKSHFLCDTLERAVLFLDAKSEDKAAARTVQHKYFQSLLEEASAAKPGTARTLVAVLQFLRDDAANALLRQKLAAQKAKPSENATFSVNGTCVLDIPDLKEFWRERRRRLAGTGSPKEPRVCIATGEFGSTLDTTEKVKGVPGGLATGTNLISFDKDAFSSFGLEQAQNAALSARAELGIRSALNGLIEKSREDGLVFSETIHLHWTRQKEESDPLDLLVRADLDGVKALIESVSKGREVSGNDDAYYALSLSGNGARIVVRDWLESTVPEIRRNIADWFSDLSVIQPDGVGIRRDFKFGALLYGMVRADLSELPPQLATQLFHGALKGRGGKENPIPLPQTALAAALRRQQLDQENKLQPARVALIKACLLRSPKFANHSRIKGNCMTECLNPESDDPAYLCGRLFAVFDRLQSLALPGLNTGVVERFYASASVTPALVMGRLFRNAQFHLAKTGGGVATNVRKDFESITSSLGDHFPPTLGLEGQGRFALGYYHQHAEFRRRAAERREQKSVAEETL